MNTLSKPAQEMLAKVRAWVLARVRPLARAADRLHVPPPGAFEVLNEAPARATGVLGGQGGPSLPGVTESPGVVAALVAESMAFGDVWAMFAGGRGGGLGHAVVQGMGTPEQKERWLKPYDGWLRSSAFALTEPHFGSDPSQVATTARRDGDSWVLNGKKMYCSGGANADFVVVFATIDKEAGRHAIRAFVVEKGTPGANVTKANEDKLGIRSAQTSELTYENCRVPLDHCLGFTEKPQAPAKGHGGERQQSGFVGALASMSSTRPTLAGVALGLARASRQVAGDWAVAHKDSFTAERWQRIQDDFGRMDYALDHARRHVLRALWQKDRGIMNRHAASSAKAFGPPIAERVIRRCLQIMGPDGASHEYLVEKWYRDVKIFDIFEGSGQIQRITIARELMGPNAARG